MLSWLNWGLGRSSKETTPTITQVPVQPVVSPRPRPVQPRPRELGSTESKLTAADREFLGGLVTPPELKPIDEFSKEDQIFLGGVLKRLHARELEMPVLPDVAIRLSEMLRQANLPVNAYVTLLNKDSALSVEVLKAANAACYGAATTTSLEHAVVRIGLSRLQSVLMLAHLRARVLNGSALFRRTGELLLELSLPLGFLASKLARVQGAADVRFVRGMLMHVEHMVILGALSDISRARRLSIMPTMPALHQAFVRFGPDIRETVASSWNLADVLLGERAVGMQVEYTGLREALTARWLGRPLPVLTDIDSERLEHVMMQIHPRVIQQPDTATA